MIYLILFIEFFKIGLFSFGGGLAMLPIIQEVVFKHNWLTEAEFLDVIAISQITPGPI
ncbi:MAG: chromate transporter, partial [Cetobacterium sp.]